MKFSPASPRKLMQVEWRQLVMLNYEIDPAFLQPWVPEGLKLDFWKQKTYVSLVALMNRNVRVFDIPALLHRRYAQINLRFYVRRKLQDEERRGVMFIKQVVPKSIIAAAARFLYNEQCATLPMRHQLHLQVRRKEEQFSLSYSWQYNEAWNDVTAQVQGSPVESKKESLERFISERHWGYSGLASKNVLEYHVDHPPWLIRKVTDAQVGGDSVREFYGKTLGTLVQGPPDAAFLAEGSKAILYAPTKI